MQGAPATSRGKTPTLQISLSSKQDKLFILDATINHQRDSKMPPVSAKQNRGPFGSSERDNSAGRGVG